MQHFSGVFITFLAVFEPRYCCFAIRVGAVFKVFSRQARSLFASSFSGCVLRLGRHVNKVCEREAGPTGLLSTFGDQLPDKPSTHSERGGGAVVSSRPGRRIFKRKHYVDSVRRRTGLCAEWSRALLQWPPFSFWFQARRRVAAQCNPHHVPISTNSSRTSSRPWIM